MKRYLLLVNILGLLHVSLAWKTPLIPRKPPSTPANNIHRRLFVLAPSAWLLVHPTVGHADDKASDPLQNRPFAPVAALVPATKQRLLLQRATVLAEQLTGSDGASSSDLVEQLRSIVASPSVVYPAPRDNSLTRPFINDSKILAQVRLDQLSGAALRAAMNAYTSQLRFGESYVLTADPATKKRFLREYNRLPDVQQVIAADLDLRDLYRNQAQTAADDLAAELAREQPDPTEIVSLVREIGTAVNQWFGLIAERDVEQALARGMES